MIHTSRGLLLYTALLAATACGKNSTFKEASDSAPSVVPVERLAQPEISDSFAASTPQGHLTLNRDALGKVFLLVPTLIEASNAPIPASIQAKVVTFEENGHRLALFEFNPHASYFDLPGTKLLASFPILKSDDKSITFDFSLGLSAVPTRTTTVGSDFPNGLKSLSNPEETVLPAVATYIEDASVTGNTIQIMQVSRVRLPGVDSSSPRESVEATVRLHVRISPYIESRTFKPRISTEQRRLGYFETPAPYSGGENGPALAYRWDTAEQAGPITYAISSNTPPELVNAIRDGVLYWKRVHPGLDLRVETGADPAEFPLVPRRSIIRWIPWSDAKFARASLQADPLTGEILNSDIFLTSVWDNYGRETVWEATEARAHALQPSRFTAAAGCELSDGAFSDAIAQVRKAAKEAPESFQRARSDMIRLVVAHEVGHTLGLRHNFAGSLESKLPSSEAHMLEWDEYLEGTKEGAIISSSVMDYLTGIDNILLGAAIAHSELPYDTKAIQWGYAPEEIPLSRMELPLFCTDAEQAYGRGAILGCDKFDSGANPIHGDAQKLILKRDLLGFQLAESLLARIRPVDDSRRVSARRAAAQLDPDRIAHGAAETAYGTFLKLSTAGRSLRLEREMGIEISSDLNNWLTGEETRKQSPARLSQELTDAGGLATWIKNALGREALNGGKPGWLAAQVRARVEHAEFRKGTTRHGVTYELGDVEYSEFLAHALALAHKVEVAFMRNILLGITGQNLKVQSDTLLSELMKLLSSSGKLTYAPGVIPPTSEALLSLLVRELVAGTGGTITGRAGGRAIAVDAPLYDVQIRLAAIRLMSDRVFNRKDWMQAEQATLTGEIRDRLLKVTKKKKRTLLQKILRRGRNQPTLEGRELSPELADWARNELMVYQALRKIDESGSDLFDRLLAASIQGISPEAAGIVPEMWVESL